VEATEAAAKLKSKELSDAQLEVRDTHSRILSSGTGSGHNTALASSRSAQEDDGTGWVNPENYKKYIATGGNMALGVDKTASDTVDELAKCACITTDFSMQNVMLQMGLQVISVDGMMIKSVKQWVLRCMACYTIHYDMDRLFCSKCGAHHMSRVGASIDARTGELRLHLRKNYKVNTTGTKFSLPNPGSRGRYEGEILLREDQLLTGIWRQKSVKIRRNVASHFGEDVTSDLGLHVNKGDAIVVGVGKKNPNAVKGRERRGKKSTNSVF
jgi:RNA-binding protein NOB1